MASGPSPGSNSRSPFYADVHEKLTALGEVVGNSLEEARRPIDELLGEEENLKERRALWEKEKTRMENRHKEEMAKQRRQETALKEAIHTLEERIKSLDQRINEHAKEEERRRGFNLTLPSEEDVKELFAKVFKDASMIVSNVTKFANEDSKTSITDGEIYTLLSDIFMEIVEKSYSKVEERLKQALHEIFGKEAVDRSSADIDQSIIVADIARNLLAEKPTNSHQRKGQGKERNGNVDQSVPKFFGKETMKENLEELMKANEGREKCYSKIKEVGVKSSEKYWEVIYESLGDFVDYCCVFAWKWLILPSKGSIFFPCKHMTFQEMFHEDVSISHGTTHHGKLVISRCRWPGLKDMAEACLVKAKVIVG